MTEPQNMLIRHMFFHCELFPWLILLAECEIFNFADSQTFISVCLHTSTVKPII